MKQWYQIKEQAAGEKRLMLTWYIYKLFGKKALYFIGFWVTLFTFIFAKEIRGYSKKYLNIVYPYTGLRPALVNQFRHFLSYTQVLIDRIELFSNNFDKEKLVFDSEEDKAKLFSDFARNKGVFFLCSHVGNTDAMRIFFIKNDESQTRKVNVFFSKTQSQTFNNFISKISKEVPVIPYDIENIGADTAISLKDSLDEGNIAFIAGDRVAESSNAKTFEAELFGHKINFPIGSFKLVQLMDVPIYFVIALKEKNETYRIYLEHHDFTTLTNLENAYVKFIERITLISPLQFYHFYDLFGE